MKIKILFFGIIKDLINQNSLDFELEKQTTILDFKILIINNYPKLASFNSFSVAVNEEYKGDSYILQDKDIIALIPPVSGG